MIHPAFSSSVCQGPRDLGERSELQACCYLLMASISFSELSTIFS